LFLLLDSFPFLYVIRGITTDRELRSMLTSSKEFLGAFLKFSPFAIFALYFIQFLSGKPDLTKEDILP
jgi:hypothetical protein